MARHFANDVRDAERAVILIDPKGPLAELCLGLAPTERTVHYLDLGNPEIGINPLAINASPGTRAAVFLQALIEANPPGAIQAASDSFLRQAVAAVCTVERAPTLWHVYRMLDVEPVALPARASCSRLNGIAGADFARAYWDSQFPALVSRPRLRRAGAQPPAQQARAADLHPGDRHAAAPPGHARPREPPRARRDPDRRRRQGGRRRGQHRSWSPSCCCSCCTGRSKPSKSLPEPRRGLAADRRGPQRPHPLGRQDARRGTHRRP